MELNKVVDIGFQAVLLSPYLYVINVFTVIGVDTNGQ